MTGATRLVVVAASVVWNWNTAPVDAWFSRDTAVSLVSRKNEMKTEERKRVSPSSPTDEKWNESGRPEQQQQEEELAIFTAVSDTTWLCVMMPDGGASIF